MMENKTEKNANIHIPLRILLRGILHLKSKNKRTGKGDRISKKAVALFAREIG